jgi:hypothetical protein
MLAVELLAPVLGEDLRLGEAGELLEIEQLVADAGVEGLSERVLPRRSGLDVPRRDVGAGTPAPEGVGGELGPVVAAQVLRGATLGDEAIERVCPMKCVWSG